jgi:hypothetical protein
MVRLILSAVALAGFLATAHPGLADPVAPVAPEQTRATTAAATEQPAPPPSARSSSLDATAPVSAGLGKGVIPVGFGWG